MGRMIIGIAAAVALAASAAQAEGLPKQVAWTACNTGSSGYAQSVGLGNMLKSQYDVDLRIIPGRNDVSRMLPMKAGQVDICACGIASYFGQEGVFMFSSDRWGPTELYNLFNNIGRNGAGLIVAADLGIDSYEGLKGKRVTCVKGSPALNLSSTGVLAFAGLAWDDVQKVVVPGYGHSMQAIIDGQADAAYGSTISAVYSQIAARPRGIRHLPFPHNEKEAWARANAVAPWWYPVNVTAAVAIENNPTGGKSFEGAGYPYPIFIGMPDLAHHTAYSLTKAIMENYEDYKNNGPGTDGYQLKNQSFDWVFPYHPGAIRYYKEAGVWSDAAQAQSRQDSNLKRQDVLATAWGIPNDGRWQRRARNQVARNPQQASEQIWHVGTVQGAHADRIVVNQLRL